MTKLELQNVSKTFYTELGELLVLDQLSFKVEEGEIVAILGPSGSGKSTILNVIAKLIHPTVGEVLTDGEIGYMFQKDQLFEWRTVWKNVLIGLEITHRNDSENQDRVLKMLKKYDLYEFINNYPRELSGGMRQRIALIRTLATKPDVLLLDEPFSALDYQTRLMINDDIFNVIRTEKLTAILVTHDISEAIAMADKVIVLSSRPARIKNIHEIEMTIDGKITPLKKRKSPEFVKYFDKIWGELNENSEEE